MATTTRCSRVLTQWAAWSACTKSCGTGGTTSRSRTVVTPSSCGGTCGDLQETADCAQSCCPNDCSVTAWGSWGTCSENCGGTGLQTRMRSILQPPACGGMSCPPQTDTQACNTHPCEVDCVVSVWGAWGSCSKTCAQGRRERSRTVTQPALHGGSPCPSLKDDELCLVTPCTPPLFGGSKSCLIVTFPDWTPRYFAL